MDTIRMISLDGQLWIGDWTPTTRTLVNPRMVMIHPGSKPGELMIGFLSPTGGNDATLEINHYSYSYVPDESITKGYREHISGLVLPPRPGVLTLKKGGKH